MESPWGGVANVFEFWVSTYQKSMSLAILGSGGTRPRLWHVAIGGQAGTGQTRHFAARISHLHAHLAFGFWFWFHLAWF